MAISIWSMVAAGVLLGLPLAGVAATALSTRAAEQATPPLGRFVAVDGHRLHLVDRPGAAPAAPVLVFVHGASGNLRDPLLAFGEAFPRHRRLFVDRPGHGWSSRGGRGDSAPLAQAELIADLLRAEGVERAVIVGHSWGGAVAAAFAVAHPEMTAGLVFLAPASHPWPGGIDPLYHLATTPVIGRLFAACCVAPAGRLMMARATAGVFAPNSVPEGYGTTTGSALVLRPDDFVANAEDVVDLADNVRALSPRYREIVAPTLIVTGDRDAIVWPEIHSEGLARDIAGSRLVRLEGIGHMPHHAARARVIAEIERLVAEVDAAGTGARAPAAKVAE
ncbi:alpha/beta hydrolase [Siculibacillus lacustris]|uniref:Alpha/beta hydrolase n=1 Tax=Siculibacillus lacustris TaxID=1549641 RepID=A0A4Q9VWS3_9HYPH|nr:alpha/beta hydrolase [Siculibacillus lacustris]TBW40795.1 alpha/beta hydrolase [Siculibacillus lacustris]